MSQEQSINTAFILSIIIVILMALAALVGLLVDDIYRGDNAFVTAAWL